MKYIVLHDGVQIRTATFFSIDCKLNSCLYIYRSLINEKNKKIIGMRDNDKESKYRELTDLDFKDLHVA